MDTSADLGVSLDELSVEIKDDDNLTQATTVRDSRGRIDIDVLDAINSKNDFYDTLEMDASTDLGVSLDELNVEINEDDNLNQKISFDDSRLNSDVMNFENNVEIDHRDGTSTHLPTDLKTCSTHEKMIMTKAMNIEDNTHYSTALKMSNINTSTKDDSDSEFEVPDRPLAPPENESIVHSADVHAELSLNKKPAGMQFTETNQDVNIHLISQNPSQMRQEMVLSHSEISADSVIHLESSQKLKMPTTHSSLPSQDNDLKLSEANNEDSFNSIFRGDLKKTSQDLPPKSEPPISSENFNQHKISDVTKPQVIFPANPETEGGKHNEEIHSKPSIVTTADDWDNIQTIEPAFLQPSDRLSAGPEPIIESTPLTSVSDSWTVLRTADYTSVKSQIKVQVERHGLSALAHMLFGPPKLHRDLLPQRELIFCVAATPFDNNNETHNRVLQTIYRCLTGSRFDCQRFGSHWEEIGFQGKDPATDLRGTGMLALMHLLYFLQSPSTKDLARDVYKLSLHPTQNFPFCVMGINLSRICLQVLREDVYNKECNRSKDVISTINNVYAALFLHMYGSWKKGKTIMDSGFVLQETETYSRKHSKDIFKELKVYEQAKKQSRKVSDAEPIFLNVCKEDKG
ncbi:hypothetical protein BsWGS_00425 [Bradybaena similaris]